MNAGTILPTMNMRDALRALVQVLGVLAELLADRWETCTNSGDYYDQESSPLPGPTFKRLVRKGTLKGYKRHGRILVKRADVHAYIQKAPVEPVTVTADEPNSETKAIQEALSRLGLGDRNNHAA